MSPMFGSASKGTADPATHCRVCRSKLNPGLPYCPGCGSRVDTMQDAPACHKCDSVVAPSAQFCAECGYGLETGARAERRTSAAGTQAPAIDVFLIRLDEMGQPVSSHPLVGEKTTLGRSSADITFPDDSYLSPAHAELVMRGGDVYVRDLGSRNRTWHFIEAPYTLADDDLILVGSQVYRYRRLGYPSPSPLAADATRKLGSLTPAADIATLTQLRSDGSDRDVLHLSPGRNVSIGRDRGDWIVGYDPSMSGLHAQIQSHDADFVLMDAGSRNGVAVSVSGEVKLSNHSRILVGEKILRLECP